MESYLGPVTKVDTSPLPMEDREKEEFAEIHALAIARRIGNGNLLAEGTVRFAEKLGRCRKILISGRRGTAQGVPCTGPDHDGYG